MNWYKKNIKVASVTFSVADSHNMLKPMNLHNISWDLSHFIFYKQGVKIPYGTIDMDGYDNYDKFTGPLNFYVTIPEITIDLVNKLISAYNSEKNGLIIISVGQEEKSNSRSTNVIRLNVTYNETEYMETIPEFNLANGNAYALLKVLQDKGMNVDPEELTGSMNVDELEQAISLIRSNPYNMEQMTTETEQEGNMISFGRDRDQVERYFSGLEQMIAFIDDNNLKDRRITFG